ncbi:MAG TPA: hypothetical protein VGF75_01095, partial [Candidatus Saccharimonadales bacterium]
RPVQLMIIPDGISIASINSSNAAVLQITRSGGGSLTWGTASGFLGLTPMTALDFPTAGTYTYTGSANTSGSGSIVVANCKMVAFEI